MIDKKELEKFISNLPNENGNKKEKIFNDVQVEEILFLKENKISQKNIIEFVFNKYPDLKENYESRISTLKSLISKIKKDKSVKRRIKKDEKIVESNSSQSTNKEEPENKTSSILSKLGDKKQERTSMFPPDYVDTSEVLKNLLNK